MLSQGLHGHAVCLQEAHLTCPWPGTRGLHSGGPIAGAPPTLHLTSPPVRVQAAWLPWNGRGSMYEMATTLVESLPAGQPKGQPKQLAPAPRVRQLCLHVRGLVIRRCVQSTGKLTLIRHACLSQRPSCWRHHPAHWQGSPSFCRSRSVPGVACGGIQYFCVGKWWFLGRMFVAHAHVQAVVMRGSCALYWIAGGPDVAAAHGARGGHGGAGADAGRGRGALPAHPGRRARLHRGGPARHLEGALRLAVPPQSRKGVPVGQGQKIGYDRSGGSLVVLSRMRET